MGFPLTKFVVIKEIISKVFPRPMSSAKIPEITVVKHCYNQEFKFIFVKERNECYKLKFKVLNLCKLC